MSANLLATKFHQPAPSPRRIERPRLVARLNEGLQLGRPLALVSAPAGFGKTTCVVEWLSQLDLPVAWLSLDPADNDPVRFFSYFIAALQRVNGRLGEQIASALESGSLPSGEAIADALINDLLSAPQRFVLVLDDFHLIQEAGILEVLERLTGARPGSPLTPLHLVLVTREDPLLPLSRLRANDQLTEVRAGDLRFTGEEAGGFLTKMMGLALSDGDLAALEERTEGWVVGLQLAGLSMRGRPDPSGFIATLSGSHRYILNYLVEEVLSRQPEEIQSFLLQTSILAKLSGELCDAVTGRAGSSELLERLYNANLFLIPLDDEQRWYRYHHLFADLLRSQQARLHKDEAGKGDRLAELHRRASRWYAAAGQPVEAIEHALAAADWPAAVELIEQHAMAILTQGYGRTVEGWLKAIPAEMRARSLRTNLAFAWMHLLRGSYAQIPAYLKQVEAVLVAEGDGLPGKPNLVRAEWLALQSNLANVQGRASEGIDLAHRALELSPADDSGLLGMIYMGLGGSYRIAGDYPHLAEAYQQAIQHSRIAGNRLVEMLSVSALMLMALRQGELHFARQVGAQTIDRFERAGKLSPPIAAPVYGVIGIVDYLWNQIGPAQLLFKRSGQLSALVGHNAGIVFNHVLTARVCLAEGNLSAATALAEEAAGLLSLGVPAWLKPEVADLQVRVILAGAGSTTANSARTAARTAEAEAVLRQYVSSPEDSHPPFELYTLAYLRILLHRPADGSRALGIADGLVAGARQAGRNGIALQALLLRARLHAAQGQPQKALADLETALALAEPQGNLRAFLDEGPEIAALLRKGLALFQHAGYARQILAAFGEDEEGGEPTPSGEELPNSIETTVSTETAGSIEVEPLPEPLTERELDVLRLIADGLKYEEIAARLVISLNTVRFYVKQVYGKLGVNNKTKAVEAARRAGVL